ncbi:MAG TPA: hypothetical protein VFZ58_04700 [Candidatus Saccharimonadales bacterium]
MSAESVPEAKQLPALEQQFKANRITPAIWLALLTLHGDIVAVLDALGKKRLARHILGLVINLENEVKGIDVPSNEREPSTVRAQHVHRQRGLFEAYPSAMNFVVNALAAALIRTLTDKLVGAEKFAQFEQEINHFAQRHGVPASPMIARLREFDGELTRLYGAGGELRSANGAKSAALFWELALQPATMEHFGITHADAAAVIDTIVERLELTVNRPLRPLTTDKYRQKANEISQSLHPQPPE